MAEKQVRESELKAANAVSKAKQLFRPSQKAKSSAAAAARQADRDELAAKESADHMDSNGRKKKGQQLDVQRDADVAHSPAAEQPPANVATSDIPLPTELGSQVTVPLSAELNASEWVVAQLELPSLPANTTAGSSASSAGAAASASAAGGSILGGLSGIFAGAAAVGLAAGGGGGKSSAGSSAPVTVATPSSAAPVPTVAASDVIAVFSDKYTNVPVSNWNPNWGQTSTLSDAKAIGGDHIKRVLNLNYQGVQIATLDTNGVATSGVLDVSGKTSVHLDFWLEKSGNFTFKLVSKNGSANAQEAGVLLNGQAGWNSVDVGLDQFTGVDASKIVQVVFQSGSVTELHFDNLYFSSTASNYSTGIGGRLVNGYIQNAVVFQDNNGDGILNNDKDGVDEAGEEPYALTGADGKFNLVGASAKGGSLITVSSSNTIDTSTNEVVTNVFKAPANASVISPMSTLVEAGTKSGLTEAQVKVALGISESTSLLNFDPVQKALNGNADDLAAALVFKTASVMVSNLMDVGSSLIQGAKGADSTDFSSSVVNSLVSKIKANNNSPLDLADPTTVTSVLRQAVTSSSVSSSTALNAVLEKTASKLVDSNTLLIAQVSSSDPVAALEAIAKIEKSVQSTVAASVKDAVKDPSKVAALDALNVAVEADKADVPKVLKFETLDFETGSSIKADDFEGASVSPVVQDDGNTVMQFVKDAGKLGANAGVTLSTGTTNKLPTLTPLDFTDTQKLGMWVHSAQAGTKVRLEIGDSAAGGYPKDGNWVAVEASTSKAGWEYLTFDFAHPSKRWIANDGKGYEGTTALKDGVTYDMLNVFFDLGSTKLTDQTYYFDGLGYAKSSPGTPPQSIDYQTAPAIPEGYSLAFAEEFGGDIGASSSADKVAPDASHWKLETGAGGWGNGEAQTYTNSLDNAFVQNGALHIVANKTGDAITSARLKSVPTWEPYGYMEVRAKLPDAQGAWPAIWLLGKDTWPDTGEIDVMEWTKQYFNSSEVQAALHFRGTDNPADNKSAWTYGDTQVKKSTTLSSPITDFHTYQVWWTQDYIRFGVDANNDNAYFEYRKPANATRDNWPFDNPMDIILNMAIGGSYGGTIPSSNFKYEMLVDYVRVYKGGNLTPLSVLTFEDAQAQSIFGFEGAGDGPVNGNVWGGSELAADPENADNTVVKVTKAGNAQPWAGTTVNPDAPIVFDAAHQGLSLRVYSDEADIPVVLKLEGAGVQVEVQKTAAGWQELRFDFAGFIAGDAHQVQLDTAYDAVSVFVNFDPESTAGAQGNGNVYYLDDLKLIDASAPAPLSVLTFEDAQAQSIFGFEGAGDGPVNGNVWGGSELAADPENADNTVVKVTKAGNAQPWAGTTVNPDAPIVFDAAHQGLSLRVYSDEADIPVVLKLEGAGVQVEVQKTAAGWQELRFDFAGFIAGDAHQVQLDTAYDAVSVFVNFDPESTAGAQGNGNVYYLDDLKLIDASAPAPLSVLTFEDAQAQSIFGFEGAGDGPVNGNVWGGSELAADPENADNTVVKVTKAGNAQPWAGTTVNPDAPIVFDAAHQGLSLRVYSDEADIPVVLKLEGAGVQVEVQKTAAGWQELRFDFAGFIAGDAHQVQLDTAYDAVSVFVNFDPESTAGAQGNGNVYYLDDLKLIDASAPAPLSVLTFEDAQAQSIFGFEGAGDGPVNGNVWGGSELAADPENADNTVVKVTKAGNAQPWAGTTVNPDAPIVFDAAHQGLSLRVYSDEADIPVVLKLEGAGVQVEVQKTAAGWQELRFDFAGFIAGDAHQVQLDTAYDAVSVFVNFDPESTAGAQGNGNVYYLDDLKLIDASAPAPLSVLTFEDAQAQSIFGFEGAGDGPVNGNVWGGSELAADPENADNTVVKVTKAGNAQPWAGTTVNPDAPIVFDAAHQGLSLRVYSDEADIPVVLKLEGAGVQVEVQKTAAGWQELRFDFAGFIAGDAHQVQLDTAYDAVSVFVNFDPESTAGAQGNGNVYYLDDLKLIDASAPAPLSVLTFEDAQAQSIFGFEGAGDGPVNGNVWGGSELAADPENADNTVVKVTKAGNAQPWAGTTVNPDAPIVFDAAHQGLSLRVYSDEPDIPVVLKLEGAGVQVEVQKTAAGWQELRFDFAGFIAGDAHQVQLDTAYDAVSVFVNFDPESTAGAQGNGNVYYLDDLKLIDASAPAPLSVLTFEDAQAQSIFGFEGAGDGPVNGNVWGGSELAADPENADNTVVKVTKAGNAQPWAGTTVNPDAPIVFDAAHQGLSLRVYSDEPDIPVVLKLEGAGVQVEVQKTAAGWQELRFDFAGFIAGDAHQVQLDTAYDAVSVFVNFDPESTAGAQGNGNVYYLDDLKLIDASAPAPLSVLTFEDAQAQSIFGFEGAGDGPVNGNVWGGSELAADPENADNTVVKVTKAGNAQPWAGTTVNPDAPIVFDAAHQGLSLRVYSDEADIPVVLKLEGAGVQVEVQKTAAGWQELRFDFAGFIAGDAHQVQLDTAYDAVSVFVNFDPESTAGAQGNGNVYYLDDLKLIDASAPAPLSVLTFEDAQAQSIFGFEGAGDGPVNGNVWGGSELAADPENADNTVVKVTKAGNAQPWAGTTVNPDAPIVFDAAHQGLSLRVYSDEADIPVVLKLEGAGVQVEVQKTAAGWQELRFDFAGFIAGDAHQVQLDTAYDAVSVFVNFDPESTAGAQGNGNVYYLDDLKLIDASAPAPLSVLTFEDAQAQSIFGFEGAGDGPVNGNVWGGSELAADPENADNTVVKVTKAGNAQPWAGTTVNPDAPIVFDAAHQGLSLRVYSDEADIPVVLKLEGAGVQVEVQKTAAGWQELRFDFAGFIAGDAHQVQLDTAYDAVSVFVNFDPESTAGAQGNGNVYYLDDLKLIDASAPAPLSVLTFEDAQAQSIFGFEGAGDGPVNGNVWGGSELAADPENADNTVVKVTKAGNAQPWAGTTVNPDAPIVFDAAHQGLSLRVYSDEADIPVVLKLEGAGVQVEVQKTAAGWQELRFDFAGFIAGDAHQVQLDTAYDAVSAFVNFHPGADAQGNGKVYYLDDLKVSSSVFGI